MQNQERLFNDFDAINKEIWQKKIEEDLKGKPYESLFWSTREGFTLEPYYTRAELESLQYLQNYHNLAAKPDGATGEVRHWVNNQLINENNEKEANKIALQALNAGADGLYFSLEGKAHVDFEILLDQVFLNYCSVSFAFTENATAQIKQYLAYAQNKSITPESLSGFINTDTLDLDGEKSLGAASEILEATQSIPNLKSLTVNSTTYQNAGATATQEIAFTLSKLVTYLDYLTNKGARAEDILNKVCFNVATGSSYFIEIAKLKVFRLLAAKIAEAYDVQNFDASKIYIHASSGIWSKSMLDAYTNMLRNTTEAMSAIIGGCDALSVAPFNSTFAQPNEFARRISRNVSTILKEESYFHKVADPAAGSYYIETIVDKLADAAWKLFIQIEEKGGYFKAKDFIQQEIEKAKQDSLKAISQRKKRVVGANSYANPEEILPVTEEVLLAPKHDQAFAPIRQSAVFEKIRLRTEQYVKAGNAKPKAVMLMFGDAGMRRARAAFGVDFIRTAGFLTEEYTLTESFEDFTGYMLSTLKPQLIVLCAADEDYNAQAVAAAKAIKSAFGGQLLLAGNPDILANEVKEAPIDAFIHLKSNVAEVLTTIQDKILK